MFSLFPWNQPEQVIVSCGGIVMYIGLEINEVEVLVLEGFKCGICQAYCVRYEIFKHG